MLIMTIKWNQIVHQDGLIVKVSWWEIRIQFFYEYEFYIKIYTEKSKKETNEEATTHHRIWELQFSNLN